MRVKGQGFWAVLVWGAYGPLSGIMYDSCKKLFFIIVNILNREFKALLKCLRKSKQFKVWSKIGDQVLAQYRVE